MQELEIITHLRKGVLDAYNLYMLPTFRQCGACGAGPAVASAKFTPIR